MEPDLVTVTPWWRRTRTTIPAVVVLVLVMGLLGWRVAQGGGDSGGGGSRLTVIPDDELVVARKNEDGSSDLLLVPTESGLPAQRLLHDDRSMVLPNISPDRTRVAFLRGTDSGNEPWVYRLDGGTSAPLIAAADQARCATTGRPAFEPGGDRVAVMCTDGDVGTALYVVGPDGHLQTKPLVDGGRFQPGVAWGADGWIYFMHQASDGSSSLFRVPVDGGSEQPVDAEAGMWVGQPDVSTDGRLIYVKARAGTGRGDVWTWDGSTSTHTADFPRRDVAVAGWGPSGTSYFFTTKGDKVNNLYVADSLDATPREVGQIPQGPPSWGSR